MKDPNALIPVVERPGEIGIEVLRRPQDQGSPDDDPTREDPPDDEHQHPQMPRPVHSREPKEIL